MKILLLALVACSLFAQQPTMPPGIMGYYTVEQFHQEHMKIVEEVAILNQRVRVLEESRETVLTRIWGLTVVVLTVGIGYVLNERKQSKERRSDAAINLKATNDASSGAIRAYQEANNANGKIARLEAALIESRDRPNKV